MVGPQRYSDLVAQLPGMASNLLATRLRDLERHGVVQRTVLPPPAARTVYELTARGRELEPVLCALGRWGAPLLAASDSRLAFQPHLLSLGLKTLLRVEALPPESFRFAFALDVGTWLVDIGDTRDAGDRRRAATERITVRRVDTVPDDASVVVRAPVLALTQVRLAEVQVTGDERSCAIVRELLGMETVGSR
jgi:HxlR-like helix-turn-helix